MSPGGNTGKLILCLGLGKLDGIGKLPDDFAVRQGNIHDHLPGLCLRIGGNFIHGHNWFNTGINAGRKVHPFFKRFCFEYRAKLIFNFAAIIGSDSHSHQIVAANGLAKFVEKYRFQWSEA